VWRGELKVRAVRVGVFPKAAPAWAAAAPTSRYPSATADLTAATVSSGSLRNPSAGISIPLFNLYKGLLAVVIVYSFFDW
jgi:hypothetical protein